MNLIQLGLLAGICFSLPSNVTLNSTVNNEAFNSTTNQKATLTEIVDTRISASTFIVLPFPKTEPSLEVETKTVENVFDNDVPVPVPTDPIIPQGIDQGVVNQKSDADLARKDRADAPSRSNDLPQDNSGSSDQRQADQPSSVIPPNTPGSPSQFQPSTPDKTTFSYTTTPTDSTYPSLIIIGSIMGLFVVGSTFLAVYHVKSKRESYDLPYLESRFMDNVKTKISSPQPSFRYSNSSIDQESISKEACLILVNYSDDFHGTMLEGFHSLKRSSASSSLGNSETSDGLREISHYNLIRNLLVTLPDPDERVV